MMLVTFVSKIGLKVAIFCRTCTILWRTYTHPPTPWKRRAMILDRQHEALQAQQVVAFLALRQATFASEGVLHRIGARPGELVHAQHDQCWAMPVVLAGTCFNVCIQ